jgi:glycosyltransferase involved in cell wall biosynthesis
VLDIAVIIPTYNRADLIGETLQRIAAQSVSPREVIVVDDGSTDATESVVVGAGLPGLRYHKIANGGPSRARNLGVGIATAPWIAFCDSDDLWQPDHLQRHAAALSAHLDARFAFSDSTTVAEGAWQASSKFAQAPAAFWQAPLWREADGCRISTGDAIARFLEYQPVYPTTVIIAREHFLALGGYDEQFSRNPAEDAEFTWRCVRAAPVLAVTQVSVGIRKHAANFSGSLLKTAIGTAAIYEHALAHYDLDAAARAIAHREMEHHRAAAFHFAYDARDRRTARRLFRQLPASQRTWKAWTKRILSAMP